METAKKMKLALSLWVLFFTMAGATGTQANTHLHYFPLNVGNSWTYVNSEDGSTKTFTIIDAQEINGHTYYKFDDYVRVCGYPGGSEYPDDDMLFRYDSNSNKVLQYRSSTGENLVRFDFSGDMFGEHGCQMIETGISCTTPAGEFHNRSKFEFAMMVDCGEFFETLAPGLGNVEFIEFSSSQGHFKLQDYTGGWLPEDIEIVPENPTSADVVDITFSGNWPDSCIPTGSNVRVDGSDIYFEVFEDTSGACWAVITPWEQTQSVGPLSPGRYTVYAALANPMAAVIPQYTQVAEFSVAETNTYVFVPDQSTVVEDGGYGGWYNTYSIEGQFVLTVNWDANSASFDQVDAVLNNNVFGGYGQNLNNLFDMTELVGTVINDTEIVFDTNNPMPGGKIVHLDMTLADDSVQLTGGFCELWPDGFCYDMDAVARKKIVSDEVSWIPGQSSPADWSIDPNTPTICDVIHFSGPTAIFGNDCYGNQFMGGTPTLTIDPINKSIELWFQPPPPYMCPQIYKPVCGLEGSFGPLEAGQWVFSGAIPWPGQEGDSFWIPFEVTGSIYYVDADATGAGDGSSWADAYIYLQHALWEANSIGGPVEIRVAQGTYKPHEGVLYVPEFDEREPTFQLINDVTIKGGYAGFGQPDLDARDIERYETILSGDLLGNDVGGLDDPSRNENSYHVVNGSNTDANAVLEGFIITAGNANGTSSSDKYGGGMYNSGGSPVIAHCAFSGNSASGCGGGMANFSSSPSLTTCTFVGNWADLGGGMYNSPETEFGGSSPTLSNCILIGNSATDDGGGMYNWNDSRPTLTNCTFAANSAANGNALACASLGSWGPVPSNLQLTNCILWDGGNEIWNNDDSTITIIYSDVQGGWPGLGNINADPLFADPCDGDYHLKSEGWRWSKYIVHGSHWWCDYVTSPCIDAGNPGSPLGDELLTIPDDPYHDWGVNLRINMGAYGGTAEASMPPYDWALLGDLTNDGIINYMDLDEQTADWLTIANQLPGDLNRDGVVNAADFALLAQDWLAKTSWYKPPIVLEIYSSNYPKELLDIITMPQEGEITISIEGEDYYYIYASRQGYSTELYYCEKGDTIDVDLDEITHDKFNGVIFMSDVFFADQYLENTDVNVLDGNTPGSTIVAQFQTDSQGRFAIDPLAPGIYYFEFTFDSIHREEVEIQGQYQDFIFPYDAMVDKPNIYIYPEETMELDVNIVFPHGGHVTTSVPDYGTGWHITVEPSGVINGEFPCLFYEASVPDYGQYEAGWVVAQEQLEDFFRDNMAQTAFNQKEMDDFIEYWIPRLTEYPYYAIYPQYNDELEEMIKLKFSTQPANLIRLIYSVRGMETGNLSLQEPVVPPFSREGFTVAEWGVILK